MQDKAKEPIVSAKKLREYCYFRRLSDEALEELAKKLHIETLPPGAEIVKEGEPADAFYFISMGEVEVFKKTPSGKTSFLSVLGDGAGFGEMALLTYSHRTATVMAKTEVVCYKLLKHDFDEIVRTDSTFKSLMRQKAFGHEQFNRMKTLQPFELLEPERVASITDKLSERRYAPGEDIVIQGNRGDEYFIIKSGKAEVLKKMFSDDAEKVATLSEGQAFGEEALITNSPRNATVRAVEETVVWVLSKPDFDEVMKAKFLEEVSADEVPAEEDPKHVLLDVRMDVEFDEEHIPGAVNIPLDELRQRYGELQHDKEYFVYCLGGTRSASAAFLLNNQGFNAKSIKGGVNEWTGPLTEAQGGVHAPFTPT